MEAIQEKTIRFEGHSSIKPEQLICFSRSYTEGLSSLKFILKQNEGKTINIGTVRLYADGTIKRMIIQGTVLNVSDDKFYFLTNRDLDGMYNFKKKKEILFNNLFGEVPVLVSNINKNIFIINQHSCFFYLKKLLEMKDLMEGAIADSPFVKLYFRLKDRISVVEGKIIKVNRSNIKIEHLKTIEHAGTLDFIPQGKFINADIIPGERYFQYITPERCLLQVSVSNVEIRVSPIDDDEY